MMLKEDVIAVLMILAWSVFVAVKTKYNIKKITKE